MKIAVLNMNPGIDRVIFIDGELKKGEYNRSAEAHTYQGSKGVNQALMLKELGEDPTYFSFKGGDAGKIGAVFLESSGVKAEYTETDVPDRINVKLIEKNGCCTEINEKGGPYSKTEKERLLKSFAQACVKSDAVSVAGSIPQGVDNDVYKSVVKYGKDCGKYVMLDCSGDAFRNGLCGKPDLVKPNLFELSTYIGAKLSTDNEIFEACEEIHGKFGTNVICTLGSEGSVYAGTDADGTNVRIRAYSPKVEMRGFTGAGDTFLCAFFHSFRALSYPALESMTFATAASAAKVTLDGTTLPKLPYVNEFFDKVKAEKV